MLAKIYQPSRSAMQSGQARTRHWVLEFVPADRRPLEQGLAPVEPVELRLRGVK